MDVAARLLDVAMPRDSSQRPDIAAGFSQPCQKSMAKVVQHKRADWLLIVLLSLFLQRFENSLVLLLERGFLDVFALRGGGEYPAFVRRVCLFPSCFQHLSDAR